MTEQQNNLKTKTIQNNPTINAQTMTLPGAQYLAGQLYALKKEMLKWPKNYQRIS